MPTYVYACEACGKQFEQFQSFKDDPLNVCRCGVEGKVRRVIQPAGVVFKGSGWYINDSRGTSSSAVSAEKSSVDKTDKPEKADTGDKAATSGSSEAPAKADTSEKSTKREPSSASAEA
jgi:putative FmdB family regulatory protein